MCVRFTWRNYIKCKVPGCHLSPKFLNQSDWVQPGNILSKHFKQASRWFWYHGLKRWFGYTTQRANRHIYLDFPSPCVPKLALTWAPDNPVLAICSLKSGWTPRLRKAHINKKPSRGDGTWILTNPQFTSKLSLKTITCLILETWNI